MKFLYLYINLFSILIPLTFSFHPKIKFHKEWKFVLPGILIAGLVYLTWDVLFTRSGVWGFNSLYITGYRILNLPFEEVFFFIAIPYASLFTHYCISKFYPKFYMPALGVKRISVFLIVLLLLMAFIFRERAYTSVNFLVTATILSLSLALMPKLLSLFLLNYLLILIPFFLVNGVLTGSFIEEEVVWYNNAETLGIRLGTIPLEDVFYGLGMLLLAQLIAELLRKRFV